MHEKPKEWPAWNLDWEDQQKPPIGYVDGPAEIKIIESGPVRVSIEVCRKSRDSKVKQFISLGCGDAGRVIEVRNEIDWHTLGCALKAVFPLTVSNTNAIYNLGLGTIERCNNNEKKYEVPSHEWFDLTDRNGSYGVSILEDCKYGSDKPCDNVLRLTLLYSPDTEGKKSYMEQFSQDWGKHEFKYAVYGHRDKWSEAMTSWQGRRLNQPMVAFESPHHNGTVGKSYSFISLNTKQTEVVAVKKGEREDIVIVRVKELLGKPAQNVQLSIADGIESAYEVNGQEFKIADAVVENSKLTFDIGVYGIRSFALKLKSPAKKLMKPKCDFVKLPYNTDVISSDSKRNDGMMADGYSYSAELVPDYIVSESIKFKTGPKIAGRANAVICKGQELKLPSGKYNRLYILAAADEDTNGIFKVGQRETSLSIQCWGGFIGQWYNRVFNEEFGEVSYKGQFTLKLITPAYLKRDTIAWFGKHRHSSIANDPYKFTYIFKYALDMPEGCDSVILPNNEKIKIFAMTVANNQNDTTRSACLLYESWLDNQQKSQ
jgi:alpha-mannosidase